MERIRHITTWTGKINFPTFFASISSVKSRYRPIDYIRLLASIKRSCFLVSSYDVYKSSSDEFKEITDTLNTLADNGVTVLLDSGNYESFWLRDSTWARTNYYSILNALKTPLAFCFDNQSPPDDVTNIINDVVERTSRDQESAKYATICPIVHTSPDLLPEAATGVAKRLMPILIGVPERCLGNGIIERITTLKKIRENLDELERYIPIHLLGTGNPISLALYSSIGADTFDGLEWNIAAIRKSDLSLHHLSHSDLLYPLDRQNELSPDVYAIVENLAIIDDWMSHVRSLKPEKLVALLGPYVSVDARATLLKALA